MLRLYLGVLAFLLTGLFDVASGVILYLFQNQWSISPNIFEQLTDFSHECADCMFLAVGRVLLVVLIGILASWMGTPKKVESAFLQSQRVEDGSVYVSLPRSPVENDVQLARLKEQFFRQRKANQRKNVFVGVLFGLLTCSAVYTAIKCISFHFNKEIIEGVLLAATVACINLEFYWMKDVIDVVTKEEGILVSKELHPHPLFFNADVAWHICDMCGERIESVSYQCHRCDFDSCPMCFRRNKDKPEKTQARSSDASYMWRSLRLMAPFWYLVMLSLLCLSVNQGARLLLPNVQGHIIDSVVKSNADVFWEYVRQYIILSVVTGIFGGIRGACVDIIARKTAMAVRNKLFKSIVYQDISYFDSSNTGQLTSRMTNDASAMVAPLRTLVETLLTNTIMLAGGLFMCARTSWKLSMLAFTAIAPIVYATGAYAKWSRHINRQIYDAFAAANQTATEAFSNIRTVRAFAAEQTEVKKYEASTDDALRKGIKDAFAGAGTYTFTSYMDLGADVIILAYGGMLALRGDGGLTVGKLITFQLYQNLMSNAYQNLNDVINNFTKAAGAASRVLSLMDMMPQIDPNSGLILPEIKGDIEMKEVEFTYKMRPDTKVLKGVTLAFEHNKVTAIVGKSGGGKSTLIHLLMRFYDPEQGVVLLDGHPLPSLNMGWLRQHIGIVAQDTQLFATTIEDNIAYGIPHYTQAELHQAARLANAHDFIMSFEDGYQTRVGERGVRLSGGQKQRIAIARVMLRKPKLLFLDEATSSLDAESEALVQQALDKVISGLSRGCTMVLVAHRLSTVINADKIVVVNEGRIVEQGTHTELLELNGIYAKLVRRQLTKQSNELAQTDIDGLIEETEKEEGKGGNDTKTKSDEGKGSPKPSSSDSGSNNTSSAVE